MDCRIRYFNFFCYKSRMPNRLAGNLVAVVTIRFLNLSSEPVSFNRVTQSFANNKTNFTFCLILGFCLHFAGFGMFPESGFVR